MSTVFYERRSTPRDAKDEDGGEGAPKAAQKTAAKARTSNAAGEAGPAPRKKPGRKPEAELQDAGISKPKTARKPRAKKSKTEN